MMRRLNLYLIGTAFGLSVLLLIATTRNADSTYHHPVVIESQRNIKIIIEVGDGEENLIQQTPTVLHNDIGNKTVHNIKHSLGTSGGVTDISSSIDIKKILDKARSDIKYQLSNYNFSLSGVNGLKDLVMESGGTPLRSVIVSSWRSGSTFFGELLNTVPGTYYHYEPLLMHGTKEIKKSKEADKAVSMIKRMLKCKFQGLDDYFEFGRNDVYRIDHHTKQWAYCKTENKTDLCYDAEFTSSLCQLFPIQTMKLVRLRLQLVEEVLNDKELNNVKLILLVRDPRGLMQSRRHRYFCEISPDCWEPSLVCAGMISDYVAAQRLLKRYPDRLMVIRFEELALEPNITTQQLLKFLKLDGTEAVDEFLQKHTSAEVAGVHSTYKVSRNVPFKWKTALDFNYVNQLQMACKEAMHLWGYQMAYNETHMRSTDFHPLKDLSMSS